MAALAQREALELRINALLGDVETAIGQLDRLDGDADQEPEDDSGADDVGDGRTWPDYVDQHHVSRHATSHETLEDDAEDDDPREDDDPGGGNITDEPHDQEHDAECEQMQDDVPCPAVYALEPNPFDGKRPYLGRNCSNPAAGAAHTIHVAREPGQGLYSVTVEPPLDWAGLNATYATRREAWGFASGLRMVNAWPIVDLCGGPDGAR